MRVISWSIAALAFISLTSFAGDELQCSPENQKLYHCNYTHQNYGNGGPGASFYCTLTGVDDYQYQNLDDHVTLISYTPNVGVNKNQSLILTTASKVNSSFFLPNLSGGSAMIMGIDIDLSPGESPSNVGVSCTPGQGSSSDRVPFEG